MKLKTIYKKKMIEKSFSHMFACFGNGVKCVVMSWRSLFLQNFRRLLLLFSLNLIVKLLWSELILFIFADINLLLWPIRGWTRPNNRRLCYFVAKQRKPSVHEYSPRIRVSSIVAKISPATALICASHIGFDIWSCSSGGRSFVKESVMRWYLFFALFLDV